MPRATDGRPALAGHGGEALHEARRHGRRAGELGGAGEDDLARAEQLREIVRREADAAFRQIEAEVLAHRPAEPGVGRRFRRPGAFDQAAEHHAIAVGEPRLERTEDTHAHARLRRPAHHAAGKRHGKQLDVVVRRDDHTSRGIARRHFVERSGKLGAGRPGKGDLVAAVPRQRGHHVAMARGKIAERARVLPGRFERRQRVGEPAHQIGGGCEFAVGQRGARIGRMQVDRLLAPEFCQLRAKRGERARKPGRAGARPRPAQHGAFQRKRGRRNLARIEPQQRML